MTVNIFPFSPVEVAIPHGGFQTNKQTAFKQTSMVKNFRPDHDCQISKFSIVFNNIDGNASNFDSFLSEISQYKLPFSIIAIAETNIDDENSDL